MTEQKKFFFNTEVPEDLYEFFRKKADDQQRSIVKQILWELMRVRATETGQKVVE